MRLRPLPTQFRATSFRVSAALEAGVTPGRLRAQDLEVPFYGVRTPRSPAAPIDGNATITKQPKDAAAEVRVACRWLLPRLAPDHFFSHLTAAALWGMPLPARIFALPLHVSGISPHRAPRTANVVAHRLQIEQEQLTSRWGLRIPSAAETWAQLSAYLTVDELVMAGDSLIGRRGLATIDDLRVAAHRIRRTGVALLDAALEEMRSGSESAKETETRLVLVRGGLPEPELNWVLHDDDGVEIARLDMAYPRYRVGVEYDGRQHAESIPQFARDADRWHDLHVAGWTIVRVLAHHFEDPARLILERTRSALLRNGWLA